MLQQPLCSCLFRVWECPFSSTVVRFKDLTRISFLSVYQGMILVTAIVPSNNLLDTLRFYSNNAISNGISKSKMVRIGVVSLDHP